MKQSIVGLKLLRHLAVSGLKIFTVQQAKETTCELNLNPNYTTQALHHLVKEHWIMRLKKGVYAFSAESGFGEPPHDFEQESYFGIKNVWIGEAQVQMTNPERTLLDGLMSPEYCGDFQEVLHVFKMHYDQMNIERMIQYALKLDHCIEESRLQKLLHLPVKGYRKLDPSGPLKGPYNKKWMIQENIGV